MLSLKCNNYIFFQENIDEITDGFIAFMEHILDDPGYPETALVARLLSLCEDHKDNLVLKEFGISLKEKQAEESEEAYAIEEYMELLDEVNEKLGVDEEVLMDAISKHEKYEGIMLRLNSGVEHDEF